jgi:stress response protein YsnF
LADTERNAGHDTSGPNTDEAMTRSEERLHVGTETTEAGRARLRKYVVTEEEQVSGEVGKEEIKTTGVGTADSDR